jgi:YHS domain-containing protein
MGQGGLQKGCKCQCPGEDKYGELDPYVNNFPGPTSYVTRHDYDGSTGGQHSPYPQNQMGLQAQGGYCISDSWCCPQSGTGEAIHPLPAQQQAFSSPPEKSNLDYLAGYNQQQGFAPDPNGYPAMQPGQIVNQQAAIGNAAMFGNVGQQEDSPHEPRELSGRGSQESNSSRSGGRTASEWANDQEQFAHLPPLPPGWLRVVSRSTGKVYFCYPETGETTFTEPTGPPPSKVQQNNSLPPGWTEMVSRSTGRTYYWHAGLQKSQFDFPTAADAPGGAPAPSPQAPGNRSDASLPEGWTQMVSRSTGKTYYFNQQTQQSQFEHPGGAGGGSGGAGSM